MHTESVILQSEETKLIIHIKVDRQNYILANYQIVQQSLELHFVSHHLESSLRAYRLLNLSWGK